MRELLSRLARAACVALVAACLVLRPAAGASLLGGLYVTTQPSGAAVYVNGDLRGVSPCGIGDLPEGWLEVRAEMQGFEAATQPVQVHADETARVTLALVPQPAAGSLAVLVDPPGAAVELDRVARGRTPIVLRNLPAGTHRVVVRAGGHLPLDTTVSIAPGDASELSARLQREGQTAPGMGPAEIDRLSRLDPAAVPRVGELKEDAAFEPARRLIAQRRYADALRELDRVAGPDVPAQWTARAGRVRGLVRRLQTLVEAAHRQLRALAGTEQTIALRGGIRLTAPVGRVGEETFGIVLRGQERDMPLSRLAPGQIVALAAGEMPAESPANQVTFALLHAAEGQFDDAYALLRTAAEQGYDVTNAASYVQAERVWAEAVRLEPLRRATAAAAARRTPRVQFDPSRKRRVAVDTARGQALPAEAVAGFDRAGLALDETDALLALDRAEPPDAVVLLEPDAEGGTMGFDRAEAQCLLDFVRGGGGLVCVAARRPEQDEERDEDAPPPPPSALNPLLAWFGLALRPEALTVAEDAPEAYPADVALGFPVVAHPGVYGVRRVVFPLNAAPVAARPPAGPLLRASTHVQATETGARAPAMAAAAVVGTGRVVVVTTLPELRTSPWAESPYYQNDAAVFLANIVAWAAHGAD